MPRFYRIHTGLFRKYVFSLDHHIIGLQYALTSLIFLLIGVALAIIFRWQLAYPGKAKSPDRTTRASRCGYRVMVYSVFFLGTKGCTLKKAGCLLRHPAHGGST